ncbi:MAG: hypothetical protein SGARI_007838 [Bacillariaceae sp.]
MTSSKKATTPAKASPAKHRVAVKKEKGVVTPTRSPHHRNMPRKTRSTVKADDVLVSLGANGKDVVQGSGFQNSDLTDKVKSIPKYQRLAHEGREGRMTEEQPEAKMARKKQKAKVALEKRRVETEEEFMEMEVI